jgi:hypothetical protein
VEQIETPEVIDDAATLLKPPVTTRPVGFTPTKTVSFDSRETPQRKNTKTALQSGKDRKGIWVVVLSTALILMAVWALRDKVKAAQMPILQGFVRVLILCHELVRVPSPGSYFTDTTLAADVQVDCYTSRHD